MNDNTTRYMFAGHVIGAAARYHRLGSTAVNEVIPTQGAVALAPTGGRSEWASASYRYDVRHPQPKCLLKLERVCAWAEGRDPDGRFETEMNVEVDGMEVSEMLRIDAIRHHVLAVRQGMEAQSVVSTNGSKVEGLRMGKVTARITFDDEPLSYTGSQAQLAEFYRTRDEKYRKQHAGRFHTTPDGKELADDYGHHRFSLVSKIELSGPQDEQQAVSLINPYTIHWKGFGRIILGEVHVKAQERRICMVRLAMGSDGGGSGTGGGSTGNGGTTGG